MLYYRLHPRITEKRVMGDKAVFRGMLTVWGLCRGKDGTCNPFQSEVPFSQYSELQTAYSEGAQMSVITALTNAELDLDEEGNVQLKAGIVAQYVISDRTVVETAEDVYGLGLEVEAQWQMLEVPVILEQRWDTLRAQGRLDVEAEEILDAAFCPGEDRSLRDGDSVTLHQPGSFQLLYADAEGNPRGATMAWEDAISWTAAEDTAMQTWAECAGMPAAECHPGYAELHVDIQLDTQTAAVQKIPMLTELKTGTPVEKDPNRPSLILRKVGGDSLWQIAKQSGSRMEDIRKANDEQGEITPDTVLLIPVS